MPPSSHDMQSFDQAKQLSFSGRPDAAIEIYERLLKKNGSDSALLGMLANDLRSVGRREDARRRLRTAVGLKPKDPELLRQLAQTCQMCGRIDEATRAIDKAIIAEPDAIASINVKAELLLATGQSDAARTVMEPATKHDAPDTALAAQFSRLCPDHVPLGKGIEILNRALKNGSETNPHRSQALLRLGRLHEINGAYDLAFEAYCGGNALGEGHFSPESFGRAVDTVIKNWSASEVAQSPVSQVTSHRPVFIVGMPRSGTTLVERILSAHRAVHAGGERSDVIRLVANLNQDQPPTGAVAMMTSPTSMELAALNHAAVAILDSFGRLPRSTERAIDKMPLNALHLGLISRLFPHARVIYCRRDARDTCISCFANWFDSYHAFARDLSHLGSFHRDLERLMEHFRGALGLPILDVQYEELVADLEGTSRGMVSFLDLDWDDKCLRYHESSDAVLTNSVDQVRRPVYDSSIGRWRRFESKLGPLLNALER